MAAILQTTSIVNVMWVCLNSCSATEHSSAHKSTPYAKALSINTSLHIVSAHKSQPTVCWELGDTYQLTFFGRTWRCKLQLPVENTERCPTLWSDSKRYWHDLFFLTPSPIFVNPPLYYITAKSNAPCHTQTPIRGPAHDPLKVTSWPSVSRVAASKVAESWTLLRPYNKDPLSWPLENCIYICSL